MKDIIIRLLVYVAGFLWLRRDAVKDAAAKDDLKRHGRMDHAPDTDKLTDDERAERLRDIAKRLGG